jgi:DNA-3-methyladenine glycosylase II
VGFGESSFCIEVKPPFRLDLTVWALRRRPINQIDRWDGTTYRRVVFAGDAPVELAVTQVRSMDRPRLHVDVAGATSRESHTLVHQVLNRVLGLDIDLAPFYGIAIQDPRFNDLAIRFRGMRPPRFPTIFEALVNGVACQQLSLEAGLTLLNRLVASHGQAPQLLRGAGKAFPRPHELARSTPESLRTLGFSRSKGAAIIEIASVVERQDIRLDQLNSLDDTALRVRLDQLRGVGRWTAEYVLLRGYGRLDVFPGDDIGARKGLHGWLRLTQPLDYERTKKILQQWQPYAGLLYLHLLLKYLDDKEMIGGTEDRA